MNKQYQNIEQMIISNQIDFALFELDRIGKSEDSNQITMLKSHYDELRKLNVIGTLSREEYKIELNNIKFSILQLAEEFGNSNFNSSTKLNSISIAKISEEERMILEFRKERSGDIFELIVNPYTTINELTRQILISFDPDYEKNFLFREDRIEINLIKILKSGKKELLKNYHKVKETGLENGDTIIIEFDFKENGNVFLELPRLKL